MADAALVREIARQIVDVSIEKGEFEASLSSVLYADALLLLMGEETGVLGTELFGDRYKEIYKRISRLQPYGLFDKAIKIWQQNAKDKQGNFFLTPQDVNPLYYWLMHKIQLGYREVFVRGAAWAGKTFAIMQVLLTIGLSEPVTIVVLTPSMIHAKRGAKEDLLTLLLRNDTHYESNESYGIIKLDNGTAFHFIGVNSKNQQRGIKKDILFVNEVNYVPVGDYSEHLIRTSRIAISDYNPFGVPTWIREKEFEAQKEGSKIITCKVSARDNRFLSPSILRDLENLKEPLRTIFLEGEYPNRTAIVKEIIYKGEVGRYLLPKEAIEYANLFPSRVAIGIDWGEKAHSSIVLVVIDKENYVIYGVELFYKQTATHDEIIENIKDAQRALLGTVSVVVDTNDTEGVKKISTLPSLKVIKKSPVPIDNQFMALFQYKFVIWGENLWKQIQSLQMELEGYKTPYEDHALDAFRYGAYYLVSKTDPYYFTILKKKGMDV